MNYIEKFKNMLSEDRLFGASMEDMLDVIEEYFNEIEEDYEKRIKELEAEIQYLRKYDPKLFTEKQIYDLSTKWAQHDPDDHTDIDPNELERLRRSFEAGFMKCLYSLPYKVIHDHVIESAKNKSINVIYDASIKAMKSFSSNLESATGYENGWDDGVKWLQDELILKP